MTSRSWTSDVVRHVLPNGLTVLVERNPAAPVVAAVTHVKAGYFDEPDEWVGIAHVVEHMFFKGTRRRGPGQLAQETQRLGGYLNAGTIYDKTIYYVVAPAVPGALARAVDLQADALMHSVMDADELGRELEVIIQEAKRKLDTPTAVASETLFEVLFAQHRIRRWRIGTEEGLRRLTADDVRTYYRTRYTPRNTIVALVGDLEVEKALRLAEETYGGWEEPGVEIPPAPGETNPPGPAMRVLAGDIQRPLVTIGWRTVDVTHDDVFPLDMAASLLGSGRGSWLYRGVRIPGLASSARSSHYTPTEVGVFGATVETEPDRIEGAVERTLELAARLADPGPNDADLARVRSLAEMDWARRLEPMDTRATLWCEFEALGGYERAEEFYRRSMDVDAEAIRDVATRYLQHSSASAVMYLPENVPPADGLRPELWPPARNGGPILTGLSVPAVSDRATVPIPDTAAVIGGVTVVRSPGADLLLRPKRGSGLVYLGVYALGLRYRETPDTAGLSSLLVRSALRGAGRLGPEELAVAGERLGGTVVPSVMLGAVGWGITVRADALAPAAALLETIATEPSLADEAVEVERGLQASDAARALDDMFAYPIRRVLSVGLPESSYGLPVLGQPESVSSLPVDAVREWGAQLRDRRLAVVAVGDVDTRDMARVLARFTAWPGRTPDDGTATAVNWAASVNHETRNKAQSALAMAFPAARFGSPDRYPLVVTGALLSGLAGRLFEALREKRSLAYTVTAFPWLRRATGAMLTYIATSPERETEAREAMLSELARVARDPITADELERARNYAAGAVQLRLQNSHAVASEILEAWIQDDLATLGEVPERLRAVSEEDVRRVADEVFRPEARSEFVVRAAEADEDGS